MGKFATICICLIIVFSAVGEARAFDHKHAAFDAVLKSAVKDGRVNYAKLKADPFALAAYIDSLGAVGSADFDQWTGPQKMAALINAYNAFTLQSIVDRYPVKSIKDIGGVWKKRTWKFAGAALTLDDIEHHRLRPMGDPRIHAAINCASKGCPPIADFAFSTSELDAQLDHVSRAWAANAGQNFVDASAKMARVSRIFDWFGDDFVAKYYRYGQFPRLSKKESAAVGYLYAHGSAAIRKLIDAGVDRVAYTDYDWSLND